MRKLHFRTFLERHIRDVKLFGYLSSSSVEKLFFVRQCRRQSREELIYFSLCATHFTTQIILVRLALPKCKKWITGFVTLNQKGAGELRKWTIISEIKWFDL